MITDIEALHLDAFGVCIPGPEASTSEDDFRVAPSLGLALVSSGMGATGGQGRPSAKLAIWSVLGHVELAPPERSPLERMRAGLRRADEAIARLFPGGSMSPPAATFAGLLVSGRTCIAAHIGNARIYHLRGQPSGELVSVSQDHDLALELATRGLEHEIETHHADIVTRALGFAANGGPTLRELAVAEGDRFILCTRHVRTVLDDDALLEIAGLPTLERARDELLARLGRNASRNRFRTNTLILAELGRARAQPDRGEQGASHRPTRSWLYAPGSPLPEPPGAWPHPDAAWFRDVYGLVMGEDG